MSLHSFSRIWLHLVWTTLNREQLLTPPAAAGLSGFLDEYAKSQGVYLKVNFVNPDHVHAVIDLPTGRPAGDIVQSFKGASLQWANERGLVAGGLSWGSGYGCFSVSESKVAEVAKYIADQPDYHRLKTYAEEWRAFVEKHQLQWRDEETVKTVSDRVADRSTALKRGANERLQNEPRVQPNCANGLSPSPVSRIWLHLVWTTMNREWMLNPAAASGLSGFLDQYARNKCVSLKKHFVNPDHVHVLIDLPADRSVEEVMPWFKGASSHWLNEQKFVTGKFSWGRGYGCFSVSQSNVVGVEGYIANQAEHHRVKTFGEEFRAFVVKHGLQWRDRETVETVSSSVGVRGTALKRGANERLQGEPSNRGANEKLQPASPNRSADQNLQPEHSKLVASEQSQPENLKRGANELSLAPRFSGVLIRPGDNPAVSTASLQNRTR